MEQEMEIDMATALIWQFGDKRWQKEVDAKVAPSK